MKSTLVVLCLLFALATWAQSRTETADASTAQAVELHCARNGDATWDCYAVVRVDTSTDTGVGVVAGTRALTGRGRTLRAANANRVETVANALVPQALRSGGFDAVDAGSP